MTEETQTPEQVLEKATRLGYDPDRYAKDDPRWKTADEFLDFGDQLAPVLRENNKRLEEKNNALQAQITQIQQDVAKFAKEHEETARVAYEQAYTDLKARKVVALENQDFATVVDIDEQLVVTRAAEKQQKTVVQAPVQPTIAPDVQQTYDTWAAEKQNAWLTDPEMETYGRSVGELLARQGVSAVGPNFRSYLDKVSAKVHERFPEKFENTNRESASMVEGGSGGTSVAPAGKHTYNNLPKEAKETCDMLVKTNPNFTREKYCASFQWDKWNR